VLIGRIKVLEPTPEPVDRRSGIGAAIKDGVRWIYRHPTLGPMTVSSHVWFIGNNAMLTVLAPFALRDLDLSSLTFGLLFALLGVATLAGALLSPRIGDLLGVGRTVVTCRAGYPVALVLLGVIAGHGVSRTAAVVVVFGALGLWGLISGVENPVEMGYRQTITPPNFLGRVNSTARSANRTCAVLGALAGGAVSGAFGYRTAFLLGAAALIAPFVIAVVTPLRSAHIET
jgi:predicted MFS family arabinose efflux permease